ncbi:hypothetical protein [Mycobacteroides salmoniphilum]|uniref:hypothetical protein n=1 Tax=Mycobacteroides salmoniphilum TaxID=404941 RepID=UPI0014302DDF|nr:hypothetical protein [Mycobacteroides salmoniphilum]
MTVLVRETAQNSCDAAVGQGDIEFSLDLTHLSDAQLGRWTEFLLPEPTASGLNIRNSLSRSPVVLTISDRGTTGLGGPLRSDEVPLPGERPDFVNFVRNVGENKSVELSGGSYGFGKGILYNLSGCHVVITDSVCEFRGSPQRRLIGAALGDSYQHRGCLYTGRHWLGSVVDGVPSPLLDEEASLKANDLGLTTFDNGTAGTSISIVAADLGSDADGARSLERAAQFLVSTMLWHLWPRMLSGRRNRLVCRVAVDGVPLEVPDPEELPLLAPFVAAYREVADGGDFESPVRRSKPKDVGRFALKRGMAPPWIDENLSAAAPFEGRAHHCALVRQTDLVVKYLAGEPMSNELLQYGGVFRASAEADQHFAEAEPPTHDDWVLPGLTGTSRGVVQLALGFVRERLRAAAGHTDRAGATSAEPLGHFAAQLADVIVTAEGDTATATATESDSGPTGRRSRAPRFVTHPSLTIEGGQPVVHAVVELPTGIEGKIVRLTPAIVTADGIERDPANGIVPEVIGWTATATNRFIGGASVGVDSHTERHWEIRVRPVPDTVTRISFVVAEGKT